MCRYTVERSPTSVASAIVHPLKHVIWENTWERTVARSPTSVTSVCVCMLPSFCCWKLVCLVCDQEIPTTTTTTKLCLFNNKKELFLEKGDAIVVALYLGHRALDNCKPIFLLLTNSHRTVRRLSATFLLSVEMMSLVALVIRAVAAVLVAVLQNHFPVLLLRQNNPFSQKNCFKSLVQNNLFLQKTLLRYGDVKALCHVKWPFYPVLSLSTA